MYQISDVDVAKLAKIMDDYRDTLSRDNERLRMEAANTLSQMVGQTALTTQYLLDEMDRKRISDLKDDLVSLQKRVDALEKMQASSLYSGQWEKWTARSPV